MNLLKRLSLLAVLMPAIITANNNPAAPDMFAQLQQQMLAMQQQMLEMQNQLQQRDREIATLRAAQTVIQPAASTIPVATLVPQEPRPQTPQPSVESNSNARAPQSMAIGERPSQSSSPSAPKPKKPKNIKSQEPEKDESAWTQNRGLIEFLNTDLMRVAVVDLEQMQEALVAANAFVPNDSSEVEIKRLFAEEIVKRRMAPTFDQIHENTRLRPYMVNPKARINLRAIFALIHQDDLPEVMPVLPGRGLIPLPEAVDRLDSGFISHTALSLAAIAGNGEVVDALLEIMFAHIEGNDEKEYRDACEQIYCAFASMLNFSRLLPTNYADVLLEHLGFVDRHGRLRKPNTQTYPDIAKSLVAAVHRIVPILTEMRHKWIDADVSLNEQQKNQRLMDCNLQPFVHLMSALAQAPLPLLRLVAEHANENFVLHDGAIATISALVARGLRSGEKVGLLLSLGGNRTDEFFYKFGHGILKHVSCNPKLLERLKRLVLQHQVQRQQLVNEINPHLSGITPLSNIVVDYSNDELIPPAVGAQIIALQPVAEDRRLLDLNELTDPSALEPEPLADTMVHIRNLEKQKEEEKKESR